MTAPFVLTTKAPPVASPPAPPFPPFPPLTPAAISAPLPPDPPRLAIAWFEVKPLPVAVKLPPSTSAAPPYASPPLPPENPALPTTLRPPAAAARGAALSDPSLPPAAILRLNDVVVRVVSA